jgi:hypothetical protein
MRVAAIGFLMITTHMLVSCSQSEKGAATDAVYTPDKQTLSALAKSTRLKAYRNSAVQICKNSVKVRMPHANASSTNSFCKCATDAAIKGKTLEELTGPGFEEDVSEDCTMRYGPQSD